MFIDWLKLLAELSVNDYTTKGFICPECGRESVEYIYVGDSKTHIGYLPAWCKSCNKGIQISRVVIPEGIKMIEFDALEDITNIIPNFERIVPDD